VPGIDALLLDFEQIVQFLNQSIKNFLVVFRLDADADGIYLFSLFSGHH
jgi:hypothetical protein